VPSLAGFLARWAESFARASNAPAPDADAVLPSLMAGAQAATGDHEIAQNNLLFALPHQPNCRPQRSPARTFVAILLSSCERQKCRIAASCNRSAKAPRS
jgi:hypothetical protein